jgi:large subunit ribosomal protein L10
MPRPEKVQAVDELKDLFASSQSIFVTDYQGLNVADMTLLRKGLRESDVRYLIAKNTLLRRAVDEVGLEGLKEHFNGPTAVAFTKADAAAVAKILHESYKERQLPRMKAFVVEGQVFGPEDAQRLAELPPREHLLAQLVAAVESPLTSLVGTLEAILRDLVGTLEAMAEKMQSEGSE